MRKGTKIVAFVVGLLILPLIVTFLHPWTNICSTHQAIDINSGQMRESNYYWFIRYSVEIGDTRISSLINATITPSHSPAWRIVNTFSLGHRNSPHYNYHSALGQTRAFASIMLYHDLPEDEQKKYAKTVLTIWQKGNDDGGVDEYLSMLDRILSLPETPDSEKPLGFEELIEVPEDE